jgi:hypothetical protein
MQARHINFDGRIDVLSRAAYIQKIKVSLLFRASEGTSGSRGLKEARKGASRKVKTSSGPTGSFPGNPDLWLPLASSGVGLRKL